MQADKHLHAYHALRVFTFRYDMVPVVCSVGVVADGSGDLWQICLQGRECLNSNSVLRACAVRSKVVSDRCLMFPYCWQIIAEIYGKFEFRQGDIEMLAKHSGPVLHEMGQHSTNEAIGFYITFLSRVPKVGSEEARRWCAYNLPGLLKACGLQRCDKVIIPLMETLAADSSVVVRTALIK